VTATRHIEDFRGDFGSVAAMMEESWAGNASPPLLYTPEFLASYFEYPGASFALAPTLYDGADPLAFAAGFPRRVRYAGRELEIVVITFLTAAAEVKNRGYGIVIWTELVKRARAAGFDGMVNYCVEGDAMNRMIVPACRRLRLHAERVQSINYLSRVLWSKSGDGDGEPDPDVEEFMRAAAPVVERTPLARVWTRDEASWQIGRAGAITVRDRGGMLGGYVMLIADARRTPCLLVEDVLWGRLHADERVALARRLVAKAAAAGARIAVLPQLGYADTEPFTAAGFRPSQRVVHMYLTLWGDAPAPQPVQSSYLDVV
jgi:hypothetical protein